jgi:hypothetical protein
MRRRGCCNSTSVPVLASQDSRACPERFRGAPSSWIARAPCRSARARLRAFHASSPPAERPAVPRRHCRHARDDRVPPLGAGSGQRRPCCERAGVNVGGASIPAADDARQQAISGVAGWHSAHTSPGHRRGIKRRAKPLSGIRSSAQARAHHSHITTLISSCPLRSLTSAKYLDQYLLLAGC